MNLKKKQLNGKSSIFQKKDEILAESRLQYSNRSSFSMPNDDGAPSNKEKATIQSQFSQVDEVASGSDSEYSMFGPETQQSLNIEKQNRMLRRTELDDIIKSRRVASLSTKNKVTKTELD